MEILHRNKPSPQGLGILATLWTHLDSKKQKELKTKLKPVFAGKSFEDPTLGSVGEVSLYVRSWTKLAKIFGTKLENVGGQGDRGCLDKSFLSVRRGVQGEVVPLLEMLNLVPQSKSFQCKLPHSRSVPQSFQCKP